MELTINSLPDEVIQLVFSHLGVPDKLTVCLVSKKWLYLMNCKSLLNDIEVLINSNDSIKIFSSMSRIFLNFIFNDIIIDKNCIAFLQQISAHVEKISLIKCATNRNESLQFSNLAFANLSVLKVIECDLWPLFQSVPNLSQLYLSGKSTISDEGFATLKKTMKCLTSLYLPSNISFDSRAYKRFYPGEMTFETNPSNEILSFPAILSFISERASTLTELTFNSRWMSASAVKQLSCIKQLKLIKIDLHSCFECTKGLIHLFKHQPYLQVLNFDNLNNLNDNIVNALCTLLPYVEEITMQNCRISDNSLYKLLQLKMLKKLDISKCHGTTSSRFLEAFSDLKSMKLRWLNISCVKVPETIFVLVKQCKYLTTLNISNISIKDEHVNAISESLLHLQCLILCSNQDISDYGLNGYAFEEQNLESFSSPQNKNKSISNLKYLKDLRMQACNKITEQGAITAIKFQYLELLNINDCINISRRTVEILFIQNPNLKQIFWNSVLVTPDMLNMKSWGSSNKTALKQFQRQNIFL